MAAKNISAPHSEAQIVRIMEASLLRTLASAVWRAWSQWLAYTLVFITGVILTVLQSFHPDQAGE